MQKSKLLQEAEKKALSSNAPAMLVTVAAKPVQQDVKLRTEKKDKDMMCTYSYQSLQIFANCYRTSNARTLWKQLYTTAVQIRITKASINAAAVEKGTDLSKSVEF